MGIQFTSDARPPSNVTLLPNRFIRPAFGELYGFDAQQGLAIPSISVVQLGDDGATISTTGVSGATSYTYERDTSSSFSSPTTVSSGTLDLSVNDSGLSPFTTYYYRIIATDGVDTSTSATATLTVTGDFVTSTLSDSNSTTSGTNTLTFTVQPGINITAGQTLTLAGLTGTQTVDNASLTVGGAGASIFGSSGDWTQSTGTLVLTVAGGQTLSTGSDTVVTFDLQNSASLVSGVTATLDANNHNQANVSGTVLDAIFDSSLTFPTIQVFDNESDFIDQTDAPDYTIVHAKDTDKLYVWNGSGWYFYDNDSTV